MAFQELEEFFDPTLRLPIRGKTYVVASVDARTGIWCQRLLTTASTAMVGGEVTDADVSRLELDDDQEKELYERVLGEAFAEMLADGLPWEMLKHAGVTAFMWVAAGREAAEAFWSAMPGESRRPVPQDHKAPATKSARRGSRDGSTSPKPKATMSPASSEPTGD